jgi:hypothetical protein
MATPNTDLPAFETGQPSDDGGDFADEHTSATHAGEQDDDPGMEPDEDTPDSVGGMD